LSFCGYAPANDPQIVVLVVVNKPADKLVGSSCATKATANIVSSTLEYLGVKHNYSESDYVKLTTKYSVPDVTGKTYKEAKAILYIAGFTVVDGEDNMDEGALITASSPAKDASLYKNGQVVLYTGTAAQTDMKMVVIPDFTGKDIAECIKEARLSGVNIEIEGDSTGTVVSQTPLPASAAATPTQTPPTGAEGQLTATPSLAVTPSLTPEETQAQGTIPAGQTGTDSLTKVAMGTIIHIVMES